MQWINLEYIKCYVGLVISSIWANRVYTIKARLKEYLADFEINVFKNS